MHPRARTLIAELGLQPHPEGGFYREIYRSAGVVWPADARRARSALTTIYFLLPSGTFSAWHRVSSDEVWHLYEGEPLELFVVEPELTTFATIVLQSASATGGPVHTVPAGWWQAARPTGSYTLVGCTVAPGFEFEDFTLLRDMPDVATRFRTLNPATAALI